MSLNSRVITYKKGNAYLKPPQPKPGLFLSLTLKFASLLACAVFKQLGRLPIVLSDEEFIGLCAPFKRKRYREAAVSLQAWPINERDGKIQMFTKCEKMDFGLKPNKAPRAVQPRSFRFCLELGRYLKHLEHHIYDSIAESLFWGSPTVMKGYNVDELGGIIHTKWNKFKKPVAIGWDAVSFDQHVSAQALQFEHSVYESIYRNEDTLPYLKRLLKMQLRNRGYGFTRDGFLFKYQVKGGRMSGDQNTALGNCLIMCCLTKQFLDENNFKAELINNGDDCVLIMEQEHLKTFQCKFVSFMLNYGFQVELEKPVDILEKIEFCQHQPILVDGKYRMIRKPFVAISKDSILLDTRITREQYYAWSHAVADGGVALNSGIPILQTFYTRLGNVPLPRKKNQVKQEWKLTENLSFFWGKGVQHRKATIVSEETRISFMLAFNVMPNEQRYLEEELDKWNNQYDFHKAPMGTIPGTNQPDIESEQNLESIYKTTHQFTTIYNQPIYYAKQ